MYKQKPEPQTSGDIDELIFLDEDYEISRR